ncbi:MAG: T9SS type A sorting domain-containing protein, partial [candidate division WOR-3 bacterium]
SNFPRFERNPNHGGPFARNDTLNALIATNVVYHTPLMPSHLLLPIHPFPVVTKEKNIARKDDIKILTGISRSPKFTLMVSSPGELTIDLYDASGRKTQNIYKGKINEGKHIFEIKKELPSGNYFVIAKKGKILSKGKLVILK